MDSGYSSHAVAPFAKTLENVVAGLKERVLYLDESGSRRPPCLRSASEVHHLLDKVGNRVETSSPCSMAHYVATRPGRTRTLYQGALTRFNSLPTDLAREARTSLFIKWEKTVHSKRQVPRIINPRSPLFNILLGRYLHPNESQIFDALRHLTDQDMPCIAKGMTMEEKGTLIAQHFGDDYVGIGLDASRFDQTIGSELLNIEHGVYARMFRRERGLMRLLKLQVANDGVCYFGDVRLSLKYGAIRCSGDVNTSLGNCIISTVLAAQFFHEHNIHGRLLCDGDDLVMFVKKLDLVRFRSINLEEWYLRWGLRMKVETPAFVPEELEFCQSKPVWTPTGYVMVRNVQKALNCDYVGFESCGRDTYYRVLMRSIGLCGMSMAAGIPILQEWYQFGVRNGTTGKVSTVDKRNSGLHYQAKLQRQSGARCSRVNVHPSTRTSFEVAFGIDIPTQLAIEEDMAGAKYGGLAVSYLDYSLKYPTNVQKQLITAADAYIFKNNTI